MPQPDTSGFTKGRKTQIQYDAGSEMEHALLGFVVQGAVWITKKPIPTGGTEERRNERWNGTFRCSCGFESDPIVNTDLVTAQANVLRAFLKHVEAAVSGMDLDSQADLDAFLRMLE